MASFMKNFHQMHLQRLSVMMDKGYCLRLITLFNWHMAQISNPADTAIHFENNEGGTCPFTFLLGNKIIELKKMVQFTFKSEQMNAGHVIWPCMYCFSAGVDVNMNIAMRVNTKRDIKQFLILLKDADKVSALVYHEVELFINNIFNISPLIVGI